MTFLLDEKDEVRHMNVFGWLYRKTVLFLQSVLLLSISTPVLNDGHPNEFVTFDFN